MLDFIAKSTKNMIRNIYIIVLLGYMISLLEYLFSLEGDPHPINIILKSEILLRSDFYVFSSLIASAILVPLFATKIAINEISNIYKIYEFKLDVIVKTLLLICHICLITYFLYLFGNNLI